MRLIKFGGTSVGSPEGILRVKEVVESIKDRAIVVVAALDGVTDMLLGMAQRASQGDSKYIETLQIISQRHYTIIDSCVDQSNKEQVKSAVDTLLEEVANILKGVFLIGDLSDKSSNIIASYGERLSVEVVSGVIADAKRYDARKFIKTRKNFQKHTVDFEASSRLIKEEFKSISNIAIVPGYIATDVESGEITNLGRGGSDYTASIIAAAMDASILEIWTDVDGFMTADPNVISSAYVIDKLSFVEAMELCNFGVKTIYPPTIYPVYHKNIPIIVRNIFNLECKGTYISSKEIPYEDAVKAIKGISSINDTSLITIQGLGMVGVIGVNYRIFRALAKEGISVFFVSQAASENNTSIGVRREDSAAAAEVLSREFKQEIELGEINTVHTEHDLATIAIVGENMKHTPGIAGKLFDTLGQNGINVIACAQGASETNISFVISLKNLRKTLNVIHDSFFLSDYTVLNVFLAGFGLVGQDLIKQINQQLETLKRDNALNIRVVGITNSRKYIVDRNGIDLNDVKTQLEESPNKTSLDIFCQEILTIDIFNSVFVDCTASTEVAEVYQRLLDHNISVVTANKIAASSHYDIYRKLKTTARKKGIKFLYEANVGAGLPIINTITDLRNSGDKILKIEAVVSGTLNFIFNKISEDIPMSRAIQMAKEAGYAEPDPRFDLNGTDVIRKIVILSREAGYNIEQSDVSKELFIPDRFFEGSLEEFWNTIHEVDADFEARRKVLDAKGKQWKFVAVLDNGKASVSLQEVDNLSPFFHLEGSNNVISITTERYKEYPMQIKGYGAGASVTAAGVFADIISVANVR